MPRTKKKVQKQDAVTEIETEAVNMGMQADTAVKQPITIGRIVHFVTKHGKHRPAIIVEVWNNEVVNLEVFTDMRNDGMLEPVAWVPSVPHDEEAGGYTWHWPER